MNYFIVVNVNYSPGNEHHHITECKATVFRRWASHNSQNIAGQRNRQLICKYKLYMSEF